MTKGKIAKMKITNEEYLQEMSKSLKLKRETINMNYQVAVATYNTEMEIYTEQISSIDNQLRNMKEEN